MIILVLFEPASSKKGILVISVDDILIVLSLSLDTKYCKLSVSNGVEIKSILSFFEYSKSF